MHVPNLTDIVLVVLVVSLCLQHVCLMLCYQIEHFDTTLDGCHAACMK